MNRKTIVKEKNRSSSFKFATSTHTQKGTNIWFVVFSFVSNAALNMSQSQRVEKPLSEKQKLLNFKVFVIAFKKIKIKGTFCIGPHCIFCVNTVDDDDILNLFIRKQKKRKHSLVKTYLIGSFIFLNLYWWVSKQAHKMFSAITKFILFR